MPVISNTRQKGTCKATKILSGCVSIFLLLGPTVTPYNILIIYPTPAISHQQPVMSLTEALVKRGHQLFVVSPNGIPGLEKNYTFVDVSMFEEQKKQSEDTYQEPKELKPVSTWEFLEHGYEPYQLIAGKQFKTAPFQKFLKRVEAENIEFDVAIIETFFLPHGCAMTRFLSESTPLISMISIAMDFYGEEDIGSIVHSSFVPSIWEPYTDKMSVWKKIYNWYSNLVVRSTMRNIMVETAKRYLKQAHGEKYESLTDGCWSNISLSLISSNFLYYYPRLLGPNVIELGPLHMKQPEKLPQILQSWVDGAEKGVIYFSLGTSSVNSTSLPTPLRENFLKVFAELPDGYRVLWKWELDGKIPGQSDNILTRKWLPQQSILAHPKVKVFITQGGQQSFQEAVHYGVPTVGVPWFIDQLSTVAKMVDAGIGAQLLPSDLNSYEKVKDTIETVLFEESYSRNMKRLSAISREFSSQSLDKAVFWVEHVAKFNGAPHLRPATADATLFEYFCIDILCVVLTISLTCIYVTSLVFKRLIKRVFTSPSSKIKAP